MTEGVLTGLPAALAPHAIFRHQIDVPASTFLRLTGFDMMLLLSPVACADQVLAPS